MRIKSLTIYCSSSKNLESDFYNLANDLGVFLANKSIKIIYGGGNVGMMGAFTTFSAFSLEVVLMIERAQWLLAGTYIIASVVLCVGAMLLSMLGMRAFL